MMKNIILIFLFISLGVKLYSNTLDSLIIEIKPDTFVAYSKNDSLHINIKNLSQDTLVFTTDFFAFGIEGNEIPIPKQSTYYPNLLYFCKVNNRILLYDDSRILTEYTRFPSFGIILPKSEIDIIILITNLFQSLKNEEWSISGRMKVARKSKLDSIVLKYYSDRMEEYTNSLHYKNIFCIDLKDNLIDLLFKEGLVKSLDKLKDAFDINLIKKISEN
jgi:hypothetical protein